MATGKELKNAIKGKGLTVQEAADKLGISRQTLSTQFGKAEVDPDLLQNVKTKLKILLNEGYEANYTVTELLFLLRMEKEKSDEALKREQENMGKAQDNIKILIEREQPPDSRVKEA